MTERGDFLEVVNESFRTVYELAQEALHVGVALPELISDNLSGDRVSYGPLAEDVHLLPPIDAPDPYRCLVSGTGLNHLASAMARDAMHEHTDVTETDSIKMFRLGVENGRVEAGSPGAQPEWFYKGDGSIIVPPNGTLELPQYALSASEEAELAAVYLVSRSGEVYRLGFALGNEFADHRMESMNYLYLAHSKLRQCSLGPELLLSDLPDEVKGEVRVVRGGEIHWSGEFKTGKGQMSHDLANMEHHMFKYAQFRRPDDLHIHFLGASTLSSSHDVWLEAGDIVEISALPFEMPLQNRIEATRGQPELVSVEKAY